jgi:cytoskeletal protein CcmA (bactofilin family)
VVVQGKLEGNIQASDRVELMQSAAVIGDIATHRISIDDRVLQGKFQHPERGAHEGSTGWDCSFVEMRLLSGC